METKAFSYWKDDILWVVAFSYEDFVKFRDEHKHSWPNDFTNVKAFENLKYPIVFRQERFDHDSFWTNDTAEYKTVEMALEEAKRDRIAWARSFSHSVNKMLEDAACIEKIQKEMSNQQ